MGKTLLKDQEEKAGFVITALPAICVFIAIFFYRGVPFIDDAYFFFRYAENWAQGFGPVYNVGEYVEGCSSFLWLALLALGNYFGFEPVGLAAFLNLIIGIGCIICMTCLIHVISDGESLFIPVVSSVMYALTHGLAFYAAGGMDVLLFSLVLMLCLISVYKSLLSGNYLTSLPFYLLLLLVRAEGFAYAILIFIVMAVIMHFQKRRSSSNDIAWPNFGITSAVFISMVIAVFVVRHNYYGEWVPLPVIAKGWASYSLKQVIFEGDMVAARDFLRVISSGLRYEIPLLYVGAWIPFILLINRKDISGSLPWLLGSSIALNVFISIWAGGDFFPFKRHLLAVLPLLIVFMAWALVFLYRKYGKDSILRKYVLYAATIAIIVSWAGTFIKPSLMTKRYIGIERTSHLQEIGELLAGLRGPTVLLSDMGGKLPYFAGSNVYVREIYGLTDTHNAKQGDVWCLITFKGDSGTCGRTDYEYSFATHFDIFTYTSLQNHKRFIAFCRDNTAICRKYRYIHKSEWLHPPYEPSFPLRIIVSTDHPSFEALSEKPGVSIFPVNEELLDIL